MPYYPIFLDLQGKPVLVVGAGPVGLRKARGLVEAGAAVTVVSPTANAGFEELNICLIRREFQDDDLRGMLLVLTATDRREVNEHVALEAKRRGILANVADAPAECDFLVPARVRNGDVQIALSTSGRDPRMAAALRGRLEIWLAAELAHSE